MMGRRLAWIAGGALLVASLMILGPLFAFFSLFMGTGDADDYPLCAPADSQIIVSSESVDSSTVMTGHHAQQYLSQFNAETQEEQVGNARIIWEVGAGRGASVRDRGIAVVVAIQESDLINVPFGDRDSLGLFQQRPSQGWGTPVQILDAVYATNKYYDAQDEIEGRDSMSPMEVGIAVQIPSRAAYESRWAWDEIFAELITATPTDDESLNLEGGGSGEDIAIRRTVDPLCDNFTPPSSRVVATDWTAPLEPGAYAISSPFGNRLHPIFGTWLPHNGMDFAAPLGTPVYAAADGTVTVALVTNRTQGDVSTHWNTGTYITIDHGDGVETGYGHLLSIADGITPGVTVEAGQLIGLVGSTGNSTGPHLHFVTVVDAGMSDGRRVFTAVNPVEFMGERGVVFSNARL